MNQIIKFAVKYPVSVLMIVLGVSLLGFISYNKLGTDLFPDLKNPALYIKLEAGERPPEEIEKQYITQLEAIATRQEGVKAVYSVSKAGSAYITVEYGWDQDMDMAFLDLQRSISRIGQNNSEVTTLEVSRYDANSAPTLQFALRHDQITDMNELRKIAENYMRSELVRLDGVADIRLTGQEEAYIEIKTNRYLMDSYNLTPDVISSKVSAVNQNVSGGQIQDRNQVYTIKGMNLIQNIDQVKAIIVAFKSVTDNTGSSVKAPVYLSDVADITLKNKDPENIVRYNGERCLGISVYKENKFNTVQAVKNLTTKLDEFKRSMPGYDFHVINNQGVFIENSIGEVKDSALLGIFLAMIILYVFLRRLNVTAIMSVSIPVSIIATFNLMYFNGLSVNIMTLGGLALGAGMLVDNAIVVMENIFRHIERGEKPTDAAIKGATEISGAITASTLTTIVVFLPIVYIQGAAGELFKEQAWTVTFSLISSLFVALLLIPMLAARYITKNDSKDKSIRISGYDTVVGKILDHRYLVVTGAVVIMAAAYAMLPYIDKEFMPKAESNEFIVNLTMAPGTRLTSTSDAAETLEYVIRSVGGEDVEWVYTTVGPDGNEGQNDGTLEGEHQAQIKIKLRTESAISVNDLVLAIDKQFNASNGISLSYKTGQSALEAILDTEGAPLVVEIKGEKLEILQELSDQVVSKLQGLMGIYDIKSSMAQGAPEISLSIDRLKSGIYGIDITSVAQQVKKQLNGTEAGEFEQGGELINMEIRVPETQLAQLENVEITQGDKRYRLAEIADVKITSSPKEIRHRNQSRMVEITAQLDKTQSLSAIAPHVQAVLESIEFPTKYTAKITGEEEKRAESFSGLSFALILSIILVYMVMASQFESLRHPFTILLTIPLAGVGCIVSFLIAGASLNMMAFIGIIMLGGIAVNNSILIVDAANRLQDGGLSLRDALMEAGQQRIRPIIMTSLTTILALLPMCFGFGEGASLRSPMALAVIGGLFTSTIMTLVVIPCMYYIIDRKR
ncbi:MAG: efflux RND transporter permease subunit [Marinifilaceae bacterium]